MQFFVSNIVSFLDCKPFGNLKVALDFKKVGDPWFEWWLQ